MNKSLYILFILLFGIWIQVNAQSSLSGKIINEDEKPLENVIIHNLANRMHTHTDRNGLFLLENASLNDSLEISHPGYAILYYVVGTDNNISIRLTEKSFTLEAIVISADLKQLSTVSKIDLEVQPVATSQELLRKVPGLFIGQHAGGGKAEQIFLRGFDIDHGTDISITVDGMPVNMVSHAHGQGYADLHFLIPETVEAIDFDKGTYFAEKGDFTTAGYVDFKTKDRLNNSQVALEAGMFNTFRTSGIFNLLNHEKQSAYFAGEYLLTDNYFDAPQHFYRMNLFGKYTAQLSPHDKISLSLSHFKSSWDASGQIPDRAVDAGLISHFGAIDNTEGGNTSRSNFNLQYNRQTSENAYIKNTVYLSHYDFELFSNFTFFLENPLNGDQIRQKENRTILGLQSEYNEQINSHWNYKIGIGFRSDFTDNTELSHTVSRYTVLDYLSLGNITQNNFFGYASADYRTGRWLMNIGLRVDYFKFNYEDKLLPAYVNQSQTKAAVSPKLNFLYAAENNLNFFLKLGKGFHSNDTRVVIAQNGKEILPAAYSADLGTSWKPFPKMMLNAALWYLFLEQEFVYVGDAAIVEPSGKTARKGIDLGIRYQLTNWLFWNTDVTYTHARAIDEVKGEDYIPLAPVFTLAGGLSVKDLKGFSGGIRVRYLGDRPADETNTFIAKGYCITDFSVNYSFSKFSIGVNIDNIFNTKWKETQFLTESRLYNEPTGVEEIHFTPGTPFNARLTLKYHF